MAGKSADYVAGREITIAKQQDLRFTGGGWPIKEQTRPMTDGGL